MEIPVIQLREGESAIVGYGSLLSIASLERTLQRRYDGPFIACELDGWKRTWDVRQPNKSFYTNTTEGRLYPENIIYLNVAPFAASRLNGIAVAVTAAELKSLDEREWMYDRIQVTRAIEGVRVEGGEAYIYVSKPEFIINEVKSIRVAAIRSTYLDIVETGLRELGVEFRRQYELSTEPVPAHLVIQDLRDA